MPAEDELRLGPAKSDYEGIMFWATGELAGREANIAAQNIRAIVGRLAIKAVPQAAKGGINQTSIAVLKNGYYEVNGFRFSEYYYNKLWNTGRGAPSLVAKEVLEGGAATAVPDAIKAGFNKYIHGGWEMIYNPTTKEVWHLQPLR